MLITKRNKALALIIMTTYSSFSFSFDIENILNIEKEKKEYTKDIDALVIGSVNNSYKAAEIKAEIQSKEQILLKDEYYFVPKVTLTSEIKEKMDRPGHPDPEADFNINLSATMKLWSDTVSDENRAAYQDLESSINKYNSVVSNVYRSIANN
ncbi:TolC family protein, partial [Vibrio mediterranei]|uniref:TolC family protein n=1 Tax=Vibrio mediterranei TaxID=689 RepID=UPI001EFC3E71